MMLTILLILAIIVSLVGLIATIALAALAVKARNGITIRLDAMPLELKVGDIKAMVVNDATHTYIQPPKKDDAMEQHNFHEAEAERVRIKAEELGIGIPQRKSRRHR